MKGDLGEQSSTPRPMRIVHVIPTLDPVKGGPPQVALRVAEAQAWMGHDVALAHLRPDAAARGRIDQLVQALPRRSRSRLVEIRWSDLGRLLLWRRLPAGVGDDPDFVHLHGLWELPVAATARACRTRGIPYAIRPQGFLEPWSLTQKPIRKRLALRLMHGRLLRSSAFLQALNKNEREGIERLDLGVPIATIPNGVFLEEFEDPPPRAALAARCPDLGDHDYLLFMARLHHGKGLDLLLDAFRIVAPRAPRLHLVVAGPDGGEAQALRRMVDESGLSSRIHMPGPIFGREKRSALAHACAFAMPSRQEAFSVSLLEALGSGLPVIATETCHFPEIAEHGAGWICPLDSAAIADSILEVVSHPDEAARMGCRGRDLVHRRFTWDAIARSLIDAYQDGIRSMGSRRS